MTLPRTASDRLRAALAASLLLHGALLALFAQAPRGWQPGTFSVSHAGDAAMRVLMRAAAPQSVPQPVPDGAQSRAAAALPLPPPPYAAGNGDDPLSRQKIAEAGSAPAQALGTLSRPRHYLPHELDEKPLIKVHVEPRFPPGAPPTGNVQLRLYIDERGRVREIAVTDAEPQGIFEAAAADAFAAARFTPGRRGGIAVKSLLTIEVLFGQPVPLADANAGKEK